MSKDGARFYEVKKIDAFLAAPVMDFGGGCSCLRARGGYGFFALLHFGAVLHGQNFFAALVYFYGYQCLSDKIDGRLA